MVKNGNEVKLLKEISDKIDIMISLFSVQGKEKEDQIRIMAAHGHSNSQMSKLLGIPKGTIDSIRAKIKKTK